MVQATVTIHSKEGLHLRPATKLCVVAGKYKCKTTISFRNYSGNLKSVISVLAAMVKQNDEIIISCDGEDEQEALDEIVALIDNLDEPE